jgi:glycosyltransferase involved in cell wall biosynthesis
LGGESTKTELGKQYILVTPVNNEEKFLPNLIQSIVNQTIKPVLWVIVDDRSVDLTSDIIKKTKEKHNWIQSLQMEEGIRDRGVHLAKVIKAGFDFAYKYSEKKGINFDYLGNVDADVVFEDIFFEKLIEKFEKDPKLGVASGSLQGIQNGKEKQLEIIYPDGGDVLYRKVCFENCGGVPLFGLWDSALNAKAKMKGWEIKRFNDCKATIIRDYCHADNLWKQYNKIGENYYIMNYNLFHTLFKGVKLCFKKPYYIGFSFLNGYLFSLMSRKKQIPDEEVKKYFWHIHPQETKRYYINILKDKLNVK